jgi:hypothetical protein
VLALRRGRLGDVGDELVLVELILRDDVPFGVAVAAALVLLRDRLRSGLFSRLLADQIGEHIGLDLLGDRRRRSGVRDELLDRFGGALGVAADVVLAEVIQAVEAFDLAVDVFFGGIDLHGTGDGAGDVEGDLVIPAAVLGVDECDVFHNEDRIVSSAESVKKNVWKSSLLTSTFDYYPSPKVLAGYEGMGRD